MIKRQSAKSHLVKSIIGVRVTAILVKSGPNGPSQVGFLNSGANFAPKEFKFDTRKPRAGT